MTGWQDRRTTVERSLRGQRTAYIDRDGEPLGGRESITHAWDDDRANSPCGGLARAARDGYVRTGTDFLGAP